MVNKIIRRISYCKNLQTEFNQNKNPDNQRLEFNQNKNPDNQRFRKSIF